MRAGCPIVVVVLVVAVGGGFGGAGQVVVDGVGVVGSAVVCGWQQGAAVCVNALQLSPAQDFAMAVWEQDHLCSV